MLWIKIGSHYIEVEAIDHVDMIDPLRTDIYMRGSIIQLNGDDNFVFRCWLEEEQNDCTLNLTQIYQGRVLARTTLEQLTLVEKVS